MRFLVDADLPSSVADLLARYGHEALRVQDVGLWAATDARIASFARDKGLCLLTGDHDFADVRAYPPSQHSGLVLLKLPGRVSSSFILQLLEAFLREYGGRIPSLVGSLAIVEPGRVRVRRG